MQIAERILDIAYDCHVDVGRALLKLVDNLWQQHERDVIGHADAKFVVPKLRIICSVVMEVGQSRQNQCQLVLDGAGLVRQFVAAGCAHEQWVVELLSQGC